MYFILHAFSRRNQGDGLLVDLTLEALEAAGIDRKDCTVLALDPESFADLEHVTRVPGEPRSVPSMKLLGAGRELLASLAGRGQVASLIKNARGLVAVGGGYLVADSPVRQTGVLLNHFAQLRAASTSTAPSVYLPQSIGPLSEPVRTALVRQLRRLDRVYARDDQTLRELDLANVRRCADLAVMKLARSLPTMRQSAPTSSPLIVARELPRPGSYETNLLRLREAMPSPRWAVQADVPGPRSDRSFYSRLGVEDSGSMSSMLKGSRPSAVVSVRLHGAIGALLAGVPAVHLAYERKGWGAYEDLGLTE
jgi:polysaccharide pyruvyl transferase WcaK-like protein